MKLKYLIILILCSPFVTVAQPDYSEIQNALNSQKAVTLQTSRTYNISNTIVIGQNQSLKVPINTTIIYSGSSAAIKLNYGGSLLGDGTLVTNPISYLTTAEKTGVLVAGSLVKIDFGTIKGFKYGLYLKGDGTGVSYCNISLNKIYDAVHFIKIDAFNSGYVSMNNIHVNRISVSSSTYTQLGNNTFNTWKNSYALYMDSHTTNQPYLYIFAGSVEAIAKGIYLTGSYNNFNGLRFEGGKYSLIIPDRMIYRPPPHPPIIIPADTISKSSIFTINNTTYGSVPDYNYWLGEFEDGFSWSNSIEGNAKQRRALQCFGVRNMGLWGENLRIAGNAYYGGSKQYAPSQIYKSASTSLSEKSKDLLNLKGQYIIFEKEDINGAGKTLADSTYSFNSKQVKKYFPVLYREVDDKSYVNYTGFIPLLIELLKTQQDTLNKLKELLTLDYLYLDSLNKQLDVLMESLNKITKSNHSNSNFKKTSKSISTDINNYAYIKQNCPNPFDNNTVIQYYCPDNSKNNWLFIYSLNGIMIKKIKLNTGINSIELNKGNLNKGIYFYTLISDNQLIETKKNLVE